MKTAEFNMLKGCILGFLAFGGLVMALLIPQPVVAKETSYGGWKFSTDIYLWMPSVKGETTTGKDLDVSFSDIVDNLDFAFMGGVKASKDKVTLLVDVIGCGR